MLVSPVSLSILNPTDEEQEIQDEADKKKQKINMHERQIRTGHAAKLAETAGSLGFPNYFQA